MKYFCLLFFSVLYFSCSSSKPDYPADISIQYNISLPLMNTNMNMTIGSGKLNLSYKNGQSGISKSAVYTLKDDEISDIYNYLKKVNFAAMQSPEAEKKVDMPQENITCIYDGKTNTINFGSVKVLPENISKLRAMIFDLTTAYNKQWRKDMNMDTY